MQWTDTDKVLNWFTGLEKQTYSLFKFDVVDFYPNISKELVIKSIKFAGNYTGVPTEDLSLIKRLVTTDFLHVKLNLNYLSYMPYKKQNTKIMYINKGSSNPKNIIK